MLELQALRFSLAASGFVGLLFIALGTVLPEYLVAWLWASVLVFTLWIVYLLVRTAYRNPEQLGFMHVLCLMTAASWLGYANKVMDSGAYYPAVQETLMLNFVGLWITLTVYARCLVRNPISEAGWVRRLLMRVNSLPSPAMYVLVGGYAVGTVYEFSLGNVMSGTGGIMDEVSMVQSILLQLTGNLNGMVNMLVFLLLLGRRPGHTLPAKALFVVQIIHTFLIGRRWLIGLFMLGGVCWIGIRGLTLRRALVAVLVAVLVAGVSAPLFLALRNTATGNGIHTASAESRGVIMAESFSKVVDEFSLDKTVDADYLDSVKDRAAFFSWTVTLMERANDGWETRWGEIALNTLIENIPRFLFPGKLEYLGEFRIEQKIQLWFQMPLEDGASTLLGYAIADGGWLGVALYFAAFGWLLGILMVFTLNARFTLSQLWSISMLFDLCFNIEAGLAPLIGTLRMLAVIFILDRWLDKYLGRRQRMRRLRNQGYPLPLANRRD